jgi:hypothetical protein
VSTPDDVTEIPVDKETFSQIPLTSRQKRIVAQGAKCEFSIACFGRRKMHIPIRLMDIELNPAQRPLSGVF